MTTRKKTASKPTTTQMIREYRAKYAHTCTKATMRNRVERAKQYVAKTAHFQKRTLGSIMKGTCAVIFPRDAQPRTATEPKVLDTATLKRLCDNAERLKFSHGPNAKLWEEVAEDGKHVVTFSMRHSPGSLWGDWRNDPTFPWDFDHNGGVNIRAIVSCQMKDGSRVDLLCDFDQPEFDATFATK